jgi:inner membrane protein
MELIDIGELLKHMTFWHWLIAGICFVIFEMLLPGVVFLWVGIAAAITGVIVLVNPDISWEMQFLAFAALSVICSVGGRMWVWNQPTETDQPHLNRRGHQYIGRQFTLDVPIENKNGKLKVDDTSWRISGEDMPAGTTIEVTGVDGVVLQVQKYVEAETGL